MTETVRYLTILIASANVGAIIAFYGKAAHKLVPSSWARGWLGGDAIIMSAVAWANAAHIHRAVPPQLLLLNVGAVIQLAGIVGMWKWYGTPAGQARIANQAEGESDIAKRFTRWVLTFSGILLVMWIFGGYYALSTNHALCTYRAGLKDSVESTSSYLDKNHGPVLGIPRSVLLQNLKVQQQRLRSLHALRC